MNKSVYPAFLIFYCMFLFIGFTTNWGNASEINQRPLDNDLPVYSPPEEDQS